MAHGGQHLHEQTRREGARREAGGRRTRPRARAGSQGFRGRAACPAASVASAYCFLDTGMHMCIFCTVVGSRSVHYSLHTRHSSSQQLLTADPAPAAPTPVGSGAPRGCRASCVCVCVGYVRDRGSPTRTAVPNTENNAIAPLGPRPWQRINRTNLHMISITDGTEVGTWIASRSLKLATSHHPTSVPPPAPAAARHPRAHACRSAREAASQGPH